MEILGTDHGVEILEAMDISGTVNTGPTIAHQGYHSEYGNITLVNDASGNFILIK